jgi:hypothetical protein
MFTADMLLEYGELLFNVFAVFYTRSLRRSNKGHSCIPCLYRLFYYVNHNYE